MMGHPAREAALNARIESPSTPPRVLVVDDSEIIRELVRRCLELRSFQVVEASDGEEALELLGRDQDFDVLIVDIQMPRLDGLGLIQKIRQDQELPPFPIIVLTAEDV